MKNIHWTLRCLHTTPTANTFGHIQCEHIPYFIGVTLYSIHMPVPDQCGGNQMLLIIMMSFSPYAVAGCHIQDPQVSGWLLDPTDPSSCYQELLHKYCKRPHTLPALGAQKVSLSLNWHLLHLTAK